MAPSATTARVSSLVLRGMLILSHSGVGRPRPAIRVEPPPAPVLVEVAQEGVPLRPGAGSGIGLGPDGLFRTPDDVELTALDDLPQADRLPGVQGVGVDVDGAFGRLVALPLEGLADGAHVVSARRRDRLGPEVDAEICRLHR